MNLRTTIFLAVVVALSAAGWYFRDKIGEKLGYSAPANNAESAASLEDLEKHLTRDKIREIEVAGPAGKVKLEKGEGGTWALPGKWPTRPGETEELVDLLTHLRTRFQLIPLKFPDPDWKSYHLDPAQKPVQVDVESDQHYRLWFAEGEQVEGEPFARPTYMKIDGRLFVVRLGPGILPVLKRPQEYYQRRQLFPSVDRVKFEDNSPPTMPGQPEQATGFVQIPRVKSIELDSPQGKLVLKPVEISSHGTKSTAAGTITAAQLAEHWEIIDPVRDFADPERLKALLSAIPDLWVDSFMPPNEKALVAAALVASPSDAIANVLAWLKVSHDSDSEAWLKRQTGLDQPKYKVIVTMPTGDVIRLAVGNVSQVKERPGVPPPPRPGAPPLPPLPVREEYRYAQLEGQPLTFQIRADKFNDLFIAANSLRDDKLARFQSRDVNRVEIKQPETKLHLFGTDFTHPGTTIVLVREKDDKKSDKWRITQPIQALAENDKIAELLDRLSGLEAREKDVIDHANLKETGFEPPTGGQITLSLEEELPGAGNPKPKRTRVIAFTFGKHDAATKHVNVRVAGRDRVNVVDDAVVASANRPALAYRGRRVLDFEANQVARIDVKDANESFTLQQNDGDWKLTAPVTAPADKAKAVALADDFGRLDAVEYVNDAPKTADLAAAGLDKPELTATIVFANSNTSSQTLSIGKQREKKTEYFARIGDGSIFVISKDQRDKIEQGSLNYRMTQLWTLTADDLTDVKVDRGGDAFELKKEGFNWKIVKPFDATAAAGQVTPIVDAVAALKLQGYQAHSATQLAEYGLEKPQVKLTFSATEKGKAGAPDVARNYSLLLGKGVPGKPEVYAKLADDPAIFKVADSVVLNTNKSALDLLDRKLLALDGNRIAKIEQTGKSAMSATKQANSWRIQAGSVSFIADQPTIAATLRTLEQLQAEKFAAYGSSVKLGDFGLSPPSETVKVTLDASPESGPETHELKLGKAADGGRFVQVDSGPGVAVLPTAIINQLAHGYLDYADRSLFTLDEASIQSIRRQMKGNDLEIDRKDGWKIARPSEQKADEQSMDDLVHQLSGLRADRVAAYGATDLKQFGLDSPAAVITISDEKDGKQLSHVLKIGAAADPKDPDGGRFVTVEGAKTVDVLARMFVRRLLAPPIAFRDRMLVKRLPDVDKVELERGDRAGSKKAVFAKVDGTWKMTAPVAADAEHSDLEEFVNSLYKLRADEFVADKASPEKLKEYGLDKPEAAWHFFSGDREVLSIQIGKRDATDQRVYAKLGNSDFVFLLEPGVSSRAIAEYRKRSLWTGFDAAQIDVLTFGGSAGSQTLRKVNGAWQVDGKPEMKLRQDAVTDMIAALANLKAERFASDKDAPMELYGLAKPHRTIQARTSSGQTQELHLGNREGGGSRVYAAIPGRTEVFVLSDVDTSKLDRDVKSLSEK